MAYSLKKSTLKGRTYLSIVESYYSPIKHGAAHRTFKSLASVETWKAKGIEDPIAHFQAEVDKLNNDNKNSHSLQITSRSPEMFLGYFPFVSMMKKMNIKKHLDLFNVYNSFEFDLYEVLSSLIYARLINPCRKYKTFHEVIPQLKDDIHFSYDQLLYANQIPIGIKLFPGNKSEKPVLRKVIQSLKDKHQISGKTIHVADKGLNCAQNIAFSRENGDGYLFSKSVKSLPEAEKTWVLLDNDDWKEVKNHNGTVLYKYKSCIDKFPYTVEIEGKKKTIYLTEKRLLTYNPRLAVKKKYEINKQIEKAKASINDAAIDKELKFAGYNLLVTSETKMNDIEIYDTYHNLWRIEESFKIMKSDLDARPVFLQKENSIKGHFLICYLAVLLERIFQFKILNNQYSTHQIMKFIRNFKIVKGESKYINITTSTEFIKEFKEITNLPLTNYYLTERQIKQIFNYKI